MFFVCNARRIGKILVFHPHKFAYLCENMQDVYNLVAFRKFSCSREVKK